MDLVSALSVLVLLGIVALAAYAEGRHGRVWADRLEELP